jgi:hypothetical protein
MKLFLTTLLTTLLLSGCDRTAAEFTESGLDDVNILLRFNSPAEVTGLLIEGGTIADAVGAIDPTVMRSVSIVCSPSDSVLALPLLQGIIIPVSLSTAGYRGRISVGFTQDGLTWLPGYSWNIEGDSATVTASVTIRNLTGRSWTLSSLTLVDDSGTPVCGRQDSLTLPEGELHMRWWDAAGAALPLSLVYGWPIPGQWNPLQPMVVNPIGALVGTIAAEPDLPLRTGDTLWIPAPEGIVLTETLEQLSTGYAARLEIENATNAPMTLRLSHPDILPRGARFVEMEGFSDPLMLEPLGSATVEWGITYR